MKVIDYVIECAACHGKVVIKVIQVSDRWRQNYVCPYCHAAITVTSDLEQRPAHEH